MKASAHDWRMRTISIILILFALLLFARLYYVQILHGAEFSGKAAGQYVRPSDALFDRGNIYFTSRDGERVPGATLKTGYMLTIVPTHIEDPEATYEQIAQIVEIDKEDFIERASKPDDPYEEIAKMISAEDAEKITDLDIKGVHMYKHRWRYYPGGEMAAHTLGLVAFSGTERSGQYGLERYYEQVLARSESNVYINFFAEIFSNIRDTITYSDNKEGDIVTTLEPTVQSFLDIKLEEVKEEWSSELVAGIVMDPKTGEIVAMSALPTFNPNDFSEQDARVFTHPLVENVYEMGSIIKPLTVAAGLDAGAVAPETTYYDAGYLVLNTARIQNYDGVGRGTVDMQEVLNQSLNTGVAFIASEMGNAAFAEYMLGFGLGEKSGIDMPNDTSGLVSNLQSPREIEHATASYGQGIAMSPVATVRALATLANGGTLVTPHVVKEIDYSLGLSRKTEQPEPVRVLKESTSEEISRMLTTVVDEALLEGQVKLDRYSVAAKTGTAQIPDPSVGGYYDDRFLHTFFGYFPAYEPRFIVFLFNYHPKEVRYASETLTHPFMDITKFLINYYDIDPDR